MVAFNTALNYQPSNWYWIIGADTGNVWSSARAMLVPTTDPDYVAWSGLGLQPLTMASMADLEATLANTYPPGTPRTYAADQRYRKASGSVIITSLSDVPFLSDPVSRNTIARAHDYAVANPGHITDWKLADGVTFIKLDEPQLAHAVQQIATFVQACFSCESTLSAGITDGSITMLAQIDAAFAAISNELA